MIFRLSESYNEESVTGNKAHSLITMKEHGFNVPDGIVIDAKEYEEVLRENGIYDRLNGLLRELGKDNISTVSSEISELFDALSVPDALRTRINDMTDEDKLYAVRSSGTMEDLGKLSFAGQYLTSLNVPKGDIVSKVLDCYRSMFSVTILNYLVNNSVNLNDYRMCVVVQEMVNADFSGICFTINPSTGNDKEMLIEVSEGIGEDIVSGRTKPERYLYDWYEMRENGREPGNSLINSTDLELYAGVFARIQQLYGYPCDIEFAVSDKELYILQAREISAIQYRGIQDIWTTADFKDGGVSASVCTPYMWSLYEYIWEYSLRRFIVDSDILRDDELPAKLGEMFFGRCYWNMSAVKKAMSKVIGYKEREFDNEYGIVGSYEGDGQTTGITPRSVAGMIKIALKQKKLLDDRRMNSERYKKELLDIYNEYKDRYDNDSITDIESDYRKLTHDSYLRSETTYFHQIFINTIHQSIYKDSLLKYVSESDYLSLLGSIDNISHLLPFYEMWDITREIRLDPEVFKYWQETSGEGILADLFDKTNTGGMLDSVRRLIDEYGYHSDKELDITYPCYYEDPLPVVLMVKDMSALTDEYSPKEDRERGNAVYESKLEEIRKKVSKGRYKKICEKIKGMRSMLWWREEFRDVSTRYYYLLRIYTLKYADKLVKQGVLKCTEDIWYLKVGHLWDYLDGRIKAEELSEIIEKNRRYYKAYRNYISDNELGSGFKAVEYDKDKDVLQGLGAGNGTITGTARVIGDFTEIDRLKEGDILVTRFTDTGWTAKFAILSGIVTEYGGILCHAAIVSREYGIPAVVCCKDAMDRIRDGQTITIDGASGKVIINDIL